MDIKQEGNLRLESTITSEPIQTMKKASQKVGTRPSPEEQVSAFVAPNDFIWTLTEIWANLKGVKNHWHKPSQ